MKDNEKKAPRRTRWAVRGVLAALLLLALAYLRCGGSGLGFGGGGGEGVATRSADQPPPTVKPLVSEPSPATAPAVAEPVRCQLRLDGAGLWQLGSTGQEQVAVAAAVAECKRAGGADVVVTGDARQGAWDELRAALDGEGVPSFVRGGGAGSTGAGAGSGAPKPAADAAPPLR
jgi:hypothetical protein